MLVRKSKLTAYLLSLLLGVCPALVVAQASPPAGLSVPAGVVEDIQNAKAEEKTYIVWMHGDPVVAYDGDIPGLKATRPAKGKKLNPNKKAVIDYKAHLHGRQNAAMQAAGIAIRPGSVRLLAEEAPYAYKDVDEVARVCEAAGLAARVARLRPIGVVKG